MKMDCTVSGVAQTSQGNLSALLYCRAWLCFGKGWKASGKGGIAEMGQSHHSQVDLCLWNIHK